MSTARREPEEIPSSGHPGLSNQQPAALRYPAKKKMAKRQGNDLVQGLDHISPKELLNKYILYEIDSIENQEPFPEARAVDVSAAQ